MINLVSGGAVFLGSHRIDKLIERGDKVEESGLNLWVLGKSFS